MKTNAFLYSYIRIFVCILASFYSINVYATTYAFPSYPNNFYATCYDALKGASSPDYFNGVCPKRSGDGAVIIGDCPNPYTSTKTITCIAKEPTPTAAPSPTPAPCPYPKQRINGQCQDDCKFLSGTKVSQNYFKHGPDSAGTEHCSEGCFKKTLTVKCGKYLGPSSDVYVCSGVRQYTGEYCDPSTGDPAPPPSATPNAPSNATPAPPPQITPQPETPESKCVSQGMGFGTFNGQTICIPPSQQQPNTESKSSTEEKTNPDGTKTKTITNTTSTDDGSGNIKTNTTKTTTTGNGGTRPDGTKCTDPKGCTDITGEGSKDQPKDEFCKENPTSDKCKPERQISADCQNFECKSDDPVSCEIAKVNWKAYCEMHVDKDDVTLKIGQEALKGDASSVVSAMTASGMNFKGMVKPEPRDNFLPRGCFQDMRIDVYGGHSLTLPFSKLCDWFDLFGKLVLIFASFACIRIVFKD